MFGPETPPLFGAGVITVSWTKNMSRSIKACSDPKFEGGANHKLLVRPLNLGRMHPLMTSMASVKC
jgi:hypothetical protein